jgi:heat shock protein HslJ
MRRLSLTLACLSMLALSACATTQAAASSSPALGDTTWRFVELDGKPLTNPAAKLTFTEHKLSANLGCNTTFGPWRMENQHLITGPLAQTNMYCVGEAMQHDGLVSALLAGTPTVTGTGDSLTLQSGEHSARLQRLPAGQ